MTAKSAAIALAILFGGFSLAVHDAQARTPDGRQGKPSARAAAAPAPAAARRTAANPTARATVQRGRNQAVRVAATGRGNATTRNGRRGHAAAAAGRSGGISCVPYARQATGMDISGNGRDWWHNAAGLYARGSRPEPGSIMAFPGSGGMRSGHVAVVERVVSSREVHIHHANWGGPGIRRGSIMRGVSVIDASPGNDWTQVRVQVGHSARELRPHLSGLWLHLQPAGRDRRHHDGRARPAAGECRAGRRPRPRGSGAGPDAPALSPAFVPA
jgi:surface antigen